MLTSSPTGSKFVVALGVTGQAQRPMRLSRGAQLRGGPHPMVSRTGVPAGGYATSANALSQSAYRFDDPAVASRCLDHACRRSSLHTARVLLGETGHTASDSVGATGSGSFAHTLAPDGAWALVIYPSNDHPPNSVLLPLPIVCYGIGPASAGLPSYGVGSVTVADVATLGEQFFDLLVLGAALA